MRRIKYLYNKTIVLDEEKEFLDNPKAYRVLKALVQETEDFSDKSMAKKCNMSLNTYQKYKNHLVFVGLLQVRKLNATTYFISVGEEAIELDDYIHKDKDFDRMQRLVLEYLQLDSTPILIERGKKPLQPPKIGHLLNGEKKGKFDRIISENSMPTEEEIMCRF